MGYLIDTSAWIDYFEGNETGEKVHELINSDLELYTPIIAIAELSDAFHRKDLIKDYSWKQVRGFVETRSVVLNMTGRICSRAGKTKSEEMEDYPNISLIDCIILEQAREKELKILSSDKDLRDRPESADL